MQSDNITVPLLLHVNRDCLAYTSTASCQS